MSEKTEAEKPWRWWEVVGACLVVYLIAGGVAAIARTDISPIVAELAGIRAELSGIKNAIEHTGAR